MKKISTLFKKDPNNLGRVINKIDPQNQWVFDGMANATRKWDGTACIIIDGEIYKRYDAKHGKLPPDGAIPCQEPDPITGHWPHWVKCDRNNPADIYFFEGLDNTKVNYGNFLHPIYNNETFELVGPKINGGHEFFINHRLLRHKGEFDLNGRKHQFDISFDGIKTYFEKYPYIEGIVFHHKNDDRMCKIRLSDFGIKRVKPISK